MSYLKEYKNSVSNILKITLNDDDKEKCILIADNVIYPGAPDFLRYVDTNLSSRWKTDLKRMPFERKGYETKFKEVDDAMSISVRHSMWW